MSARATTADAPADPQERMKQKQVDWFFFQVLLPLGMLMAVWPLGQFIWEIAHAFEQAFSYGDLIVFASLLVIGATLELGQMQLTSETVRRDFRTDCHRKLGILGTVFLVILFVAIKGDMMIHPYFSQQAAVPRKLYWYGICGWSCAVSAIIFSFYALRRGHLVALSSAGSESS